jgi:calcium channel MID1
MGRRRRCRQREMWWCSSASPARVCLHLNAGATLTPTGPLHALTSADPYLGDTTSQTALIFSPLLQSSPHIQPSYPNYTLPPAQLVLPTYSSPQSNFFSNSAFIGNYPNLTLIMTPTGSSPTNEGLDNSLCAIRSANGSTGGVANLANMVINQTEPSWMSVGDEEGFRVFWMVGDLVPSRNYTAWIYDENQRTLSRPIWLATKEGWPTNIRC